MCVWFPVSHVCAISAGQVFSLTIYRVPHGKVLSLMGQERKNKNFSHQIRENSGQLFGLFPSVNEARFYRKT